MAPAQSVTADELRPFLPSPARAAAPPTAKVRYCSMSRCEACGLCAWLTFGAVLITWVVCVKNPKTPNMDQAFIDQQLGGDPVYGWTRLPARQMNETYWSLRDQLSNQTTVVDDQVAQFVASAIFGDDGIFNLTFGQTSAAVAPKLMYQATRVPGLFEKVPQKLRGVFWMDGNGVAEVLVSLQNGQWFPDGQVHIAPMSPFSWAWPDVDGVIPTDAPFGGAIWQPIPARLSRFFEVRNGNPAVGVSVKFGACPSWAQCEEGSTNFTYAELQPHRRGDVRELSLLTPVLEDFYTIEELPGPQPGSIWRRGIWWGPGSCTCVEFGTYTLKKVIDADGNPLEPYYTEFVNFMGATPVKLWSGFVDGAWLRAPPAR